MKKNEIFKLLFLLIAACVSSLAYSQEGPFGLYWGESESQIKARGVSLVQNKRDGEFVFFRTNKTPKNLSVADVYSLIVHDRYGLQKVTSYSKDVKDDITGSEGKKLYSQFKDSISEKYGSPKDSIEYSARRLYREYDEFYQCLRYTGCGNWSTFWNLDDKGVISIELKGLGRGVGFIILSYEGPNWSRAVDENKNQSSSKDKNAL